MRHRDPLPRPVRQIDPVWIPMPDGVRLAGRAWLPEDADENTPVPAILEYIPYRRRDGTAQRDSVHHPWFAAHGYACLRVDLRGSGDSEGIMEDEYLERELADGEEVLRWIAKQPWCDGRVGMMGISWGGFNALQIAARRPPELGAVVAVCATDDRYADDVHYMGGCLLGDNLSWASTMFAHVTCPPDPAVVGDRWRDAWLQRLDAAHPWLGPWLRHPHRDAYWRHGSICEDWDAVQVPVLAASGWTDGYTNAVFRLLENLRVPKLGLVGPWGHRYPHQGQPGPAVGFLQECLRWWDRWLKGEKNGVERQGALHVYMQESERPFTKLELRPGRWVAEPSWPSPNVEPRFFGLEPGYRLQERGEEESSGEEEIMPLQSPLSVGLFAGKWCSYTFAPDLPGDQREEDGGSLVFDSDPLEHSLEVLGAPLLDLTLSSNKPVAMVAARLSEVAENREVTRVTYGLLNLTHRDGHDEPRPLEPGERLRVRVRLNHVGHVFPAGHRLRVALSTSYFPLAWPPPEPVRLAIHAGASQLRLPVRHPDAPELAAAPFEEPEGAAPDTREILEPARHAWTVHRDLADHSSVLEVLKDEGRFVVESADRLELRIRSVEHYGARGDDFASPYGETNWLRTFRRGDWRVEIRTRTLLTGDAGSLRMRAELDAWEGRTRVRSRNWDERIRRRLL